MLLRYRANVRFPLRNMCSITGESLCYQMARNYGKSNNKKWKSLSREFRPQVPYSSRCQDDFAYSTWIRDTTFANKLCQAHAGEW